MALGWSLWDRRWAEWPKVCGERAICAPSDPKPEEAPSAKLSTDFRARLLSCRGVHCASFLIGCCNMSHERGASARARLPGYRVKRSTL